MKTSVGGSTGDVPVSARNQEGLPRPTSEGEQRRWWDRAKVAIALAALALTALGFWLNRRPLLVFASGSDFLYLPALYRDLIGHAYPARGWWLTPAPYFVPDMPLFFVARAIAPTMAATSVLYAELSLACILGAFYWIGGLVSRSRADRLLVVALTGLLFFVLARPADGSYWFAAKWLLVPTAHGGAVMMGLVLLGLGARLTLRRRPQAGDATDATGAATSAVRRSRVSAVWGHVAFTLITFATVVSDRSVLYLFIAPLLAAGLVLVVFRRVRWWRPLSLAFLVLAATKGADAFVAISRKNGWFVIPDFQSEHLPTWDIIRDSWDRFRGDAPQMSVFGVSSPLVLMLAASLVAPVVLVAVRWWRRTRPGEMPDESREPGEGALALLASVGPPSYVLALAVPIVMGLWIGPDCIRYALSGVVLPLLVLGAVALRVLERLSARRAATVASIALGIGIVAWLPVLRAPKSAVLAGNAVDPFYGQEIAFLDGVIRRHHLHNGYAGYWIAKPVNLFSETGTTVVSLDVNSDLPVPDYWISNPNWWVQRRNRPRKAGPLTAADYPIYDYVQCPSLNRQWVEARFGPPAEVEEGPGGYVLIYNRPSDVLFRNAGRPEAERTAGVAQESRIVEPSRLNRPQPPGSQWNAPGTVRIPVGGALTVRLAHPIPADFLRIQADNNDTYNLEFRLGTLTVGTSQAGPVPGMGLAGRDVNLVPATGGRAFDTIVIRPTGGDGVYSVGHVIVFTDPGLHQAPWDIEAGSIERTHTHLLITANPLNIHRTLRWLSQETTKAMNRDTDHQGPVWGEGDWCSYIFDESYYRNVKAYIERQNIRRGVGPRPYSFLRYDSGSTQEDRG